VHQKENLHKITMLSKMKAKITIRKFETSVLPNIIGSTHKKTTRGGLWLNQLVLDF
jgi:hypothetical protein